MLGYVRTDTPELRLREYDCYRALYCGLCRHMGHCTGQCSRLSLSYDFVFLAIIRMSLTGEQLNIKKGRCLLHPSKKRNMATDSATLRYCADASALLTYHKCRDDRTDEHGLKRLRAGLAQIAFRRGYRRAKKRHPELDETIRQQLAALQAYEKDVSAPPSADTPAMFFGQLTAAVFREGLDGPEARIAETIGRAIGHWIYLADAADDMLQDQRKGNFNPFLRLFGDHMTEQDAESVQVAMTRLLTDIERACLLIESFPTPDVKEILDNILYLGLPKEAKRIWAETVKGESKKNEKSL